MADILAGIAPQKDTYANWVILNPTLGKTFDGNDYSQMIFATGSPVGDILIWGMAQSFTTAFTAKQYVIQSGLAEKVVLVDTADHYTATEVEVAFLEIATQQNILPSTHDISTGNVTKTLPLVTGYYQRVSFYWTGGDGTYTLTVAVTSSETVGGITAGTWLGEGDGHMVVESDGTNWVVLEYEDKGGDANGDWKKDVGGGLECWIRDTTLSTTNTGLGTLFHDNSPFNWTYPLASFVAIPIITSNADAVAGGLCMVQTNGVTTTTAALIFISGSNGATGNIHTKATGRWRT